jgi:hypothetical protein
MISRLERLETIEKTKKLAAEANAKYEEILAQGKGVSCKIKGTLYSRPYWEGSEEEFKKYILKKYYGEHDTADG